MRAVLIHCLLAAVFVVLSGCGGGGGGSAPSSAARPGAANSVPVAVAGPDQVVSAGDSVTLDGTGSYDADGGVVSYLWTIVSRPAASSAVLSSTTSPRSVFRADAPGVYEVTLEVADDDGATGLDRVFTTASVEPVIRSASKLTESAGVSGVCFDNDGPMPCPRSPAEPFWGQDTQYLTNPLSYTDNGDGTVTDDVTSLVWQKEPDGAMYNWYEATGSFDMIYNQGGIDVCGTLGLGGRDDWRLPGRHELMSVIDYSRSGPPFIVGSYFPDPGGMYWAAGGDGGWVVDFDDGTSRRYRPELQRGLVRCVSGPAHGGGRFTDNGDGTVTDSGTGLVWLGEERTGVSWEGALGYCAGLAREGRLGSTDWRLPDVKELESIADINRKMPALDERYFVMEGSNGPDLTGMYWSSTARSGAVWVVSFEAGEVVTSSPLSGSVVNGSNRARCVRPASGGG